MPTISPYGSWASPITTDSIVADSLGLGQIALDAVMSTGWKRVQWRQGGM